MKKIGEIVSTIESGNRPSGGVAHITSGALSLGGEHIDNENGHLDLSTPKYVPVDFYDNAERGKLQANDVLICKDGARTGKVAIVRNEIDGIKAMLNEHVFLLRTGDVNLQKYLYEFFVSTIGQELLKNNVTGAGQGGLNGKAGNVGISGRNYPTGYELVELINQSITKMLGNSITE